MPRFLVATALAIAFSAAAPAADVTLKPGVAVVDPTGGTVGTVATVEGDLVVVDTGINKVSLPLSSFGKGDKGAVIGMSRAQLDAAAAEAKAKARAQIMALLTPGAAVYGSDGDLLGKVVSIEGDYLMLRLADDRKAKLPLASVTRGENGATFAMTAAQFAQAIGPVPASVPETPTKP